MRSLPPPCVREHEPPGFLIGCRLAGARNAYITTPTPAPRRPGLGPAPAWPAGRGADTRTRPAAGARLLWAGLYCPSVVELNQNGFQLVLVEGEEA